MHWISSPPLEEWTNTTAWTSSASATPSMTSPSTVSTGFSSCYTRSFTKNNNISRDTGSSSVSRCLVKGCVKFVWTVKTEYTLYPTKYLRYSCKFKQHNTIFLTNNISLTTRSHQAKSLYSSPFKKSSNPSPGFPLQLPDICEVAPVHTWLPISSATFFKLMTANTGVFK